MKKKGMDTNKKVIKEIMKKATQINILMPQRDHQTTRSEKSIINRNNIKTISIPNDL